MSRTLHRIAAVISACFLAGHATAQMRPRIAAVPAAPSPQSVALHARLTATLQPSANAWIDTEAEKIARRGATADVAMSEIRRDAAARFAAQHITEQQIDAVAFIVMMRSTATSQRELAATMASVKTASAKTTALRATATSPDTLGAMSDEQSLRLQMAMDRQSKMMTMLSNIEKKMSDTASNITQNLK